MPIRRVLLADRQPLFRSALKTLLAEHLAASDIEEAHGPEPLLELIGKGPAPDLVLLDPCTPGTPDAMVWLERLLDAHPDMAVLVITGQATPECVQKARALGARGFIAKSASADVFARAIGSVLAGGTAFTGWAAAPRSQADVAIDVSALVGSLSRQQFRVLRLLGEGLLNKQIAYGLGIGETTVKAHISAILKKLGASNRTQAAMMVSRIALPEWSRASARGMTVEPAVAHSRSI